MKSKTKKIITGVSALVLVAAVTVGGTLAYLSKLTEQRANNFTFATDDMDAMLTEPDWDGVISYVYDDDGIHPVYEHNPSIDSDDDGDTVYGYFEYGEPDASGKKNQKAIKYTPKELNKYRTGAADKPDITDSDLKTWIQSFDQDIKWSDFEQPNTLVEDDDEGTTPGRLSAQKMRPGRIANKNPIITNTGYLDEWVAAKVTFVYSEENADNAGKVLSDDDFAKVKAAIEVDWSTNVVKTLTDPQTGTYTETGKWLTNDNVDIATDTVTAKQMTFYYDKLVLTEGANVTNPIFTEVRVKKEATREQIKALKEIGGFAIFIEGYAVQDEAFANGYVWATDAHTDVVFKNSPTLTDEVDVAQPGIIASPDADES